MNIEDKLKKQNWKRRIGRDLKTNSPYPQTQINNLKQAEGHWFESNILFKKKK